MLATTTTEPVLPETAPEEEASRRSRMVAWIVAALAPAVIGPIWCSLIPTWWGSLSALVLILVLGTCAVTDTSERRIPNWATYTAVLWGLAINLWASLAPESGAVSARWVGPSYLGAVGMNEAMLGVAAALLFGLPCYLLGMVAAGDVKLCAAITALLGWKLGLLAFCTGFIVAGAAALCWVIWLLGPISSLEWLVRKVGFTVLPTLIAPPSEEMQATVDRPITLGIFFAIGVPLALIYGGVS